MRVYSFLLAAGVIGALALAFTQSTGQAEAYEEPPGSLRPTQPLPEAEEAAPEATTDDPHAGLKSKNPHAFGPMGQAAAAPSSIPVGKIDKAKGSNGRRVSEVFAQKKTLVGQTVRVRGVVVKSMAGVLGKTFLHLRDGSGVEASSNHDLTVTTDGEVKVGETITIEGAVVTDKDLGAGYRYDVMIEGARLIRD